MSDVATIANNATITQPIFDRIVNIKLHRIDGSVDIITTPKSGIKPNISISGEFTTGSIVSNVNVRITNFYTNVPLNEYNFIEIFAGYRGMSTLQVSNVTASIKGKIWIAFQESPSPDGVTYFQLITGAYYVDFINAATLQPVYWPTETLLRIVLDDICTLLTNQANRPIQLSLPATSALYTVALSWNLDWNGGIKDLLQELQNIFKFQYILDGDRLIVWESEGATDKIFQMDYFSSPPIRSAAGITFTAPWIPNMRAGDRIRIDPKYYRLTYGGTTFELREILKVQTINFEFNEVTGHNQMSVLALNVA